MDIVGLLANQGVVYNEIFVTLTFLVHCVLGAVVGSFALCYVMRAKSNKTRGFAELFLSRSSCDYCHKVLRRYELIPIVSRVAQRGRCRNCNHELTSDYLNTERIVAAVFGILGYYIVMFPFEIQLAMRGVVACSVILALYDIYYRELDIKSFCILALLLCGLYIIPYDTLRDSRMIPMSYYQIFTGVSVSFGVWLLVWLLGLLAAKFKSGKRTEGFGFGDVLVGGALGMLIPIMYSFAQKLYPEIYSDTAGYLGFVLGLIIFHLLCSSILGIMGYLLIHKNGSDPEHLPFIPYMLIGFIVASTCIVKLGLYGIVY